MLKRILLAVLAVLAIFLAFVATRPDSFEVKRELSMSAPPAVAYAQVADFHGWAAWSPWDKLDPAMKRTFDGPNSGVGAHYAWEGNKDVGKGEMKITDAKEGEQIGIELHFITPFETTNRTTFTFAKDGEGSKVTWQMEGKNNFGSKLFGLFMNMDKLVGGDFEKGLAAMKTVSEKAAADAAAAAKKAADDAAAAAPPEAAAGDAGTP
ncbi:MAG: SRPBCC family protein [Myxococcaceae bacterium]